MVIILHKWEFIGGYFVRIKNRNPWLLLLLIIIGSVIGGVIGDIFQDTFKLLSYSKTIGIHPTTFDLNILQISFGFLLKVNLASVLGIIIALIIFARM